MIDCAYGDCPVPARHQCEICGKPFCSDHGSVGRDRMEGEEGMQIAVAHPSACWQHGGFNADAD